MKRTFIIIISLIALLGLKAQECSSLWLSCPGADLSQQVLYSYTYTKQQDLSYATINVTTNGYFRLFVNNNLVSIPSYPLARAPYRENTGLAAYKSMKFDVSRYLRNDSNTVSVLCSPSSPEDTIAFSLRFFGFTKTEQPFSYDADNSWLFRPLDAGMMDYSAEMLDGREPTSISDMQDQSQIMRWLPVEMSEDGNFADIDSPGITTYDYINKVIKPYYFSLNDSLKEITYDFGNGFWGLLRVTLRDTKPGQKIYIAGSEYICKGKSDEQFILRFAASWFRKVHISGDEHFKRSNIEKVEGLLLQPKTITNFSF